MGGIARKHKMTALHALILAPPTLAPSKIAQFLKGTRQNGFMRSSPGCASSNGRMATGRSLSRSQIPEVIEYIKNQRAHHRNKTFQEEYLELLQKHGVDYDERYLWR
jgi:hypothetical protein